MTDLAGALRANPYPGRVVLLARPHDGQLLAAYALTGRSPSSKARSIRLSRGRLVVSPCGPQPHDRLRHYIAGQADARYTVFGNGEQVSDVFARLSGGFAPWFALDRVAYEPDSPIYTPRITAVVDRHDGAIWLGASRRSGGNHEGADISITAIGDLARGDIVMLSTYFSDGESVEPARHHIDLRTDASDSERLIEELLAAFDPRFLVSLSVFPPLHGLAEAVIVQIDRKSQEQRAE
ncbi:MAG: IMP cyclohydrolase [Candidatus Dormibacteria bacterium]